MVSLQAVQAHNAGLKSLAPGLVAIFGKSHCPRSEILYDASCSGCDLVAEEPVMSLTTPFAS